MKPAPPHNTRYSYVKPRKKRPPLMRPEMKVDLEAMMKEAEEKKAEIPEDPPTEPRVELAEAWAKRMNRYPEA